MHALKRLALLCLVAGCAVHAAPVMAETPPAVVAPAFDAAAKRNAIDAAAKLLIDAYIYPEMGVKAADLLKQNLAAGKYDAAATPAAFAEQVTKDLQALTHDKHLNVAAEGAGPPPGAPPLVPSYHGYVRADRLKGNIGYIVLNGFGPKVMSRLGADPAMAAVASTDALIIDVRNNGGGDPNAVSYLVSFFFDGKTPIHVNDLIWRTPGTTEYRRDSFRTEPTFVSYLDKPVYVITGPRTFSGGEEFAYDMQVLKRATLIGEVTGGGANPGGFHPIGPGLGIFLPNGRGENPITKTSWEGTGVKPDIAASDAESFAVAYGAALKALGKPAPAADVTADAVTEARTPLRRTEAAPGGEAALRKLIAAMTDGQPPKAMLSDTMAKVAEQQVSRWQTDLKRLGALQAVRFVEIDLFGGEVYEASFTNGALLFTLALQPDGKIALTWYRPK